jgi:hypothetical protein
MWSDPAAKTGMSGPYRSIRYPVNTEFQTQEIVLAVTISVGVPAIFTLLLPPVTCRIDNGRDDNRDFRDGCQAP